MRTTRLAALAAVLGVAGLVVTALGVRGDLGPGPSPDGTASPAGAVTGTPRERAPVSPTARASQRVRSADASLPTDRPVRRTPVRLAIGSVGLDLPVRPVGVAADGQMELPDTPSVLGWYRFGPAAVAGEPGSAVIAGHLDTLRDGVGPLVRLREVQVGDLVRVVGTDGRPEAYEVTRVQRFDRQALPPEIFARSGPHRLRVITCGGEYLPDAGGYQQNLVVTAVPA